jgi:hypothetical protein
MLREEILRAVGGLGLGETVADLDQAKALQHDGGLIFKTRTLLRLLKDAYGEVSAHVLCRHLRDLQFESKTVRIDGTVVRVWTTPAAASATPPPGSSTNPATEVEA